MFFDVIFKQKDHRGQDQQPGLLSQIADDLSSCFEKKASELADQPR